MLDLSVDDQPSGPRELISQAEFARRVGVTPQAISLAKKAGRFTAEAFEGKKVVWPTARDEWVRRQETRGGNFKRSGKAMAAVNEEQRSELRDARVETERLRQEKLRRELERDRDEYRSKAEVERAFATIAVRIKEKTTSGIICWAPELAELVHELGGLEVEEAKAFLKKKTRDLLTAISDDLATLDEDPDEEGD